MTQWITFNIDGSGTTKVPHVTISFDFMATGQRSVEIVTLRDNQRWWRLEEQFKSKKQGLDGFLYFHVHQPTVTSEPFSVLWNINFLKRGTVWDL